MQPNLGRKSTSSSHHGSHYGAYGSLTGQKFPNYKKNSMLLVSNLQQEMDKRSRGASVASGASASIKTTNSSGFVTAGMKSHKENQN